MTKGRRETNEFEFQGRVVEWLNDALQKRPGFALDKATQEKPRKTSGKRSDVVVWKDRVSQSAFLAIEIKTPTTLINDPTFLADALEKAQFWNAPYFAIWNMREAELYATPPEGRSVAPSDAVKRWPALSAIRQVEDWLDDDKSKVLRKLAIELLEAAWSADAEQDLGQAIDAEIFVARLTDTITRLRTILYREVEQAARKSKSLQRTLRQIAAKQGFIGFVDDINYAIAGQMGHRLIAQILFYFALRRKQPSLKPIQLTARDAIPAALLPYWNNVRRFDYEALFKPEEIDNLVDIPTHGQVLIRKLVNQLAHYDWASLTDDVLGAVFERLIPRDEQILLGQFYTPRHIADLLVALTLDGERPLVLDPGCGSGTFLMSAYDYLADRQGLSHKDLLATVWGFDLSPFAAELAAINLFRQDLSEFENFPRIVPGNFFDREPGETVEFPPPKITPKGVLKVPVPIPIFDCIVGNPPYLRSQNQNDLDEKYREQLFYAARLAGIKAEAKTDLFAFFIYHSMRFMKTGSRLGFVTPASWLTSDYAIALQKVLLTELRLIAVVGSIAESFFPQVNVNAVLLIAERTQKKDIPSDATLRFATLKAPISQLVAGEGNYWKRLSSLVEEIEGPDDSIEDERMRLKIVSLTDERKALVDDPTTPRNWSKYLRAPLSYYQLFGDAA